MLWLFALFLMMSPQELQLDHQNMDLCRTYDFQQICLIPRNDLTEHISHQLMYQQILHTADHKWDSPWFSLSQALAASVRTINQQCTKDCQSNFSRERNIHQYLPIGQSQCNRNPQWQNHFGHGLTSEYWNVALEHPDVFLVDCYWT